LLLRPVASLTQIAPQVWWLSLLNATACTVVPVLLVMMAIERIGSGLTAQVGMVGPLSTIAMGVLILGEPMNFWIVAGSALVFSGIYVCSRWRAK
jgi:drug/metabolite transporter (DMT)-like permease